MAIRGTFLIIRVSREAKCNQNGYCVQCGYFKNLMWCRFNVNFALEFINSKK